jgi:hypothetical protein
VSSWAVAGATAHDSHAPQTGLTIDQLVEQNLPLVGHVVRETMNRLPGHINRDDLVSAGMTALVASAHRYESGRGPRSLISPPSASAAHWSMSRAPRTGPAAASGAAPARSRPCALASPPSSAAPPAQRTWPTHWA